MGGTVRGMPTTVALAAVAPVANTLSGQGWKQVGELGLALLLSAAIGLKRELRGKDAGLRTHCLVGVGSALFMLIGAGLIFVPGRRGRLSAPVRAGYRGRGQRGRVWMG